MTPSKHFFYFSKADRRAIFAIFCIALFCAGIVCVVSSIDRSANNSSTNVADFNSADLFKNDKLSLHQTNKVSFCDFDPNTVDSATLVSFGLKTYKVKNFLHYRAAGKVFRSIADLRNTYGWTDKDVEMLAPYVKISDTFRCRYSNGDADANFNRSIANYTKISYEDNAGVNTKHASVSSNRIGLHYQYNHDSDNDVITSVNYPDVVNDRDVINKTDHKLNKSKKSIKFNTLQVVDVNMVDSATLRMIPGIGEKTCIAIIRYREKLGGLYDVTQLLDIGFLSPELLKWFKVSDRSMVRRIRINDASFFRLNSHPYIKYEQAKDIMRFIRLYGKITGEEELMSTGIFSVDEMAKLRPYLDFDVRH